MRLVSKYFRTWLEHHEPKQVVGWGCSADDCPIARFSTRSIGKSTGSLYVFADNSRQIPKWGQSFAMEVDKSGHADIIASRALKILDAIT